MPNPDLVLQQAALDAGLPLAELRGALRDIREVLLDGLDEKRPGAEQRDHLREIAKVMTRPTIARFTRGA